jgi:hypothetical protein
MSIPTFRNRPDCFRHEADKKLYHFLRRRDRRKYLEQNRLRFDFGRGGTIQFVPAAVPCRTSPYSRQRKWITVSTMAFDNGRVYLNFGNHRERVANTFDEVLPLLVESYRQIEHCGAPQETYGLLSSIPEGKERPDPDTWHYPSRRYTPFHLEVVQYRHARGLLRRAAFERWKAAQPTAS